MEIGGGLPPAAPADALNCRVGRIEVEVRVHEGLNADDPGVRLLAEVAQTIEPEALLLAHCGDLPGLRPGATRLILDVRERTGSPHLLVADLGRGDTNSARTPGREENSPLPFGDARFAAAMVWPRAHLGKDFSEACLAVAALGLREGGRLYCAVRKQKGGKSLGKTMKALLGEDTVDVIARDRGYHLWAGTRGPSFDRELADELSSISYEIRDAALGELVLDSRPGVFCRRELDAGTRALIEVATAVLARESTPTRILDLCAGIGPLALWAAAKFEGARVLAIESNLRACALLRANAERNGLAARVEVCEHAGLPAPASMGESFEPVDLVLLNPPTHADGETLRGLLDVREWLRPGGQLLLVVTRPQLVLRVLAELGARLDGGERDGYVVIQARWA